MRSNQPEPEALADLFGGGLTRPEFREEPIRKRFDRNRPEPEALADFFWGFLTRFEFREEPIPQHFDPNRPEIRADFLFGSASASGSGTI